MTLEQSQHISILGGGPAGLAVGYYAKLNHLPFTIHEASSQIGGNCVTFSRGEFRFDSGAHRLHSRNREAIAQFQQLLGSDLLQVDAPSQIYHNGQFIDFPLSPINLCRGLGWRASLQAGLDWCRSRCKRADTKGCFENFARFLYGDKIASQFLLNYSQKLWGLPCDRLSASISGKRLQGLTLITLLKEAILGRQKATEHLDGCFYYPRHGIGQVSQKLAEFCGWENIQENSKITGIYCGDRQVKAIEVNHQTWLDVARVVSTLPISLVLELMVPQPPPEVLAIARSLRFRHLILVTLCLQKESITRNASVYFPASDFPFTRVYEPKNRSPLMAPKGKTSLVAEIPSQMEDPLWQLPDQQLTQLVTAHFARIHWLTEADILDTSVIRIPYAYPVLELDYEQKIQSLLRFLRPLQNLQLSGRNGKFLYTHLHDMMTFGKEIIQTYQ